MDLGCTAVGLDHRAGWWPARGWRFSLGWQLQELGDGNWFPRVPVKPLKHTTAADWQRQFQGDWIRKSLTMLHEESRGTGTLQSAGGRLSTITIWPRWQRGQRVSDRPVSS